MFPYSSASGVMHGSNYEHHVKCSAGTVAFEPIRYLEDFGQVYQFSAALALSTYRRVLQTYRERELQAFRRKYLENWQKVFYVYSEDNDKCRNNHDLKIVGRASWPYDSTGYFAPKHACLHSYRGAPTAWAWEARTRMGTRVGHPPSVFPRCGHKKNATDPTDLHIVKCSACWIL